jgi:hypothetical protein
MGLYGVETYLDRTVLDCFIYMLSDIVKAAFKHEIVVDSIGSWRWCITHRIKGFSDFVQHPDSKELEDKITTFRKLDVFPFSGEGRQWLRSALSKGPNRVGVSPHLKTETDPVSETSWL